MVADADLARVHLSLEETLVEALTLSRKDSRLTSVLPFLLVQKVYSLKHQLLLALLGTDPVRAQLMAYFVSAALEYHYREPLSALLKLLKKRVGRPKTPLYLRQADEGRSLRSFARVQNKAAKQWQVLTRDSLDDLVLRCRKWEGAPA